MKAEAKAKAAADKEAAAQAKAMAAGQRVVSESLKKRMAD